MKLEMKAVYNVIGTINGKEEPGKKKRHVFCNYEN